MELDLDALATRISETVPSLRTIIISLDGPRNGPFQVVQRGPDYDDYYTHAVMIAQTGGLRHSTDGLDH